MTDVRQWWVPGRVNLIGEHLDYNGGPVLPMAIDRGLTIKARARDDDQINVWSDQPGADKATFTVGVQPGEVDGWGRYPASAVWALAEAGHAVSGVDIVTESTLPVGAGLSSSAAMIGGIAVAVAELNGHDLSRDELVRLAHRAESTFVGVPVGVMDQTAVLQSELGHALLVDTSATPPLTTPVPITWDDAGLALMVINTRVRHALADGEYATRRDECEQVAAHLGLDHLAQATLDDTMRVEDDPAKARLRHVFTETARVRGAANALRQGAWAQFGTILTASHASLRDDFAVSCPELDVAVETALVGGALGARMTGAGFGGSAIALVPQEAVQRIREAIERRYDQLGWSAPEVFVVKAGTPCARLDP